LTFDSIREWWNLTVDHLEREEYLKGDGFETVRV
jgi:hypothetical protein